MSSLEKLPKIVSLELPFNVQNSSKALAKVGGPKAISEVVRNPEEHLELRLRPDAFHHPIRGRKVDCDNIILEIEVPKIALDQANGDIRKAIAIVKSQYSLRPVYLATTNFRFREIADFQYYTGESQFVSNLKSTLLKTSLEDISKIPFEPAKTLDPDNADIMPPPRFSPQGQPIFYGYRQNPSISVVNDGDGAPRLVNKTSRPKIISKILLWGERVPSGPPEELDPQPRFMVAKCIENLRKLFAERPCYTRRVLEAQVDPEYLRYLRYALPYVSYFYRSGPWRGAYIRYGDDPSKDKSFSQYQVEHFRIVVEDPTGTVSQRPIYKFDGITVPSTRMLQLCDISDDFLKQYIFTSKLREEADASDGWYEPDTMAVIRRVLRAKLINARDKQKPLDMQTISGLVEEAIGTVQKGTNTQLRDDIDDIDSDDLSEVEEDEIE